MPAARAAMAVPCQRKCINAHPSALIVTGGNQLIRLIIAFSLMIIENTAKFFDLLGRGPAASQGMHHQLAGGPFKDALQDIVRQLTLGLRCRAVSFVNMGALALIPTHRAF